MGVKDVEVRSNRQKYYKDVVFSAMNEARIVVDELETHTSAEYWPYPSYGDILFSVK